MELNISIIVPVYNVESYIEECFLSIVRQTYSGPIECLFIDDCGTDNSIEILIGLINQYDGPIDMRLLHHEENKGLSVARNTGIRNSKGDYVFFLDSDDQLFPESIASLSLAANQEHFPDIVLGGYKVNMPDHFINKYRYDYEVLSGQPLIARAFLSGKLYCMVPNKLIRRDFIINNALWFKEGIIHEDNLWSFQSFHIAKKITTISGITYFYYVHDNSIMTASKSEKRLESTCIIYDQIIQDCKDGRYPLVGQDSLGYVKIMLNDRCLDLLKQYYLKEGNNCLMNFERLPKNSKKLICEYWFAPTFFLKTLKFLFKRGWFTIFGILMQLSIYKNAR